MYEVNDKIVYPMHGAGVVTDIQDLDLFENGEETYYKLHIVSENMEILIPVNKADEVRIRPIVSPEVIDEMLKSLHGKIGKMNKNWSKRYQNNMEILKSGDIFEVADVVKNLTLLNRQKGLSTGEKKMMTSARGFLVSEMVLVLDITKEEATDMINNAIGAEDEKKKKSKKKKKADKKEEGNLEN